MILLYSLIKCTKDLSVLLLSPVCESAVVSIETNKQNKQQTKNTSNKRKRQARPGGNIYKLFHKGSDLEKMNNPLQLHKRTTQLKTGKGFK